MKNENNQPSENGETPAPETRGEQEGQVDKSTEDRIRDLETKCETASEEAKQAYDRFLRVSADFENYKKRKTREMADFRKFANESLLKEMLPIVDNLERAVESFEKEKKAGKAHIQGIDKGIRMILDEFMKVIEKFSVKPIESIGKPFDPCFHQAVFQEENDAHPSDTVLNEIQKGYMLQDRLLRPAMVVVSKSAKTDEQKQKTTSLEKE